jgi:nicotinamide-nucleotide amidase
VTRLGENQASQPAPGAADLAVTAIGMLVERGLTVATAESLTGGLVCAALVSVPGASAVLRGGVIAYATELKAALLGVPADLLSARGAVDPEVAAAMADGARARLGADVGIATTGVAGPDPADGKPVGTVYFAIATPAATSATGLKLAGSRAEIRDATVHHILDALISALRDYTA